MDKRTLISLLPISALCIFLLTKAAAGKDDMSHELKQAVGAGIRQKQPPSMINYVDLILDQYIVQRKSYTLAILVEILKANVWNDFKLIMEEMALASSQDVDQKERENLEKKLKKQKLSCHAISREISTYYAKKYIKKEHEKAGSKPEKKYALKLIQHIEDIFSIDQELLAMMNEVDGYGLDMKNYITEQQRQVEQEEKDLVGELSKYNGRFIKMERE